MIDKCKELTLCSVPLSAGHLSQHRQL